MERWNAALTAVVTDKNLLNDIKAAEAGDKAAEQRSRSTLERIASAMLGVTEGGFAIAGMFLGVAGALAAGGVAGIPFTFGISEIPAVAVAVAGIVALALSGALGLVGEILNAIG